MAVNGAALTDLKAQIIAELIPEIVAAVESMIATAQLTAPGRLIAGTISNSGSALVLNGAGQPYIAMVSLNGAATLTSCYVPAHLAATIQAGQEVFVEAINGNGADLQIHSIRNLEGPIAADFPALTANSLVIGGLFSAGTATLTSADISGTLSAGATTLDSVAVGGNATVSGTLHAGASTLASASVTGNTTIGGTLGAGATTLDSISVGGNATVTGTLHAGASTLASVTISGAFSTGAATLASVSVSGNATVTGTLHAGASTLSSAAISGNATVSGTLHAGATTLGTTTINGQTTADSGWITTDGSGNIAVTSVTANSASGNVAVFGSGGQLTIDHAGNLTSSGEVHAYDAIFVSSASLETTNDHFGFPVSSIDGKVIRPGTTFSGSGSGTFSHGFAGLQGASGFQPVVALIIENAVNASMTVGQDSMGSSTVHVNTGTVNGWIGLAIRI